MLWQFEQYVEILPLLLVDLVVLEGITAAAEEETPLLLRLELPPIPISPVLLLLLAATVDDEEDDEDEDEDDKGYLTLGCN